MSTNVTNRKEHLEGMLEGIKVATNLIRTTYGPKGFNISVENEFYPFTQICNDAQTIIQAVQVDGVSQKRGLNFLKELMDKINSLSADGRKTTAIMLEEIFEQGINSELSGLELKKELDALIPLIEEHIEKTKQTITEEEVHKVATIAGESSELGNILGEIYKRIGKNGIIIPEGSGTYQTSYSVIEGVRFQDTGFLSPYMVYDEQAVKDGVKETRAVYENPLILVTKKKIEKDSDIESLLNNAVETGKPLVIFTHDMDSGVASRMIATHKAKVAKILIIKAPVLWKDYVFEDFAKCVGATIVEDATGVNFKNLQFSHLGTCGKITVDKEETTLVGIADVQEHLNELTKDGSDDSKLRLSWFAPTALLKLGANNESELSYKRLKCYDAINSSKSALREGVVKGGGVALYWASSELPKSPASSILKRALVAPHKQILKNMDSEMDFKDVSDDVIDSVVVIKNAVRNAIALASTMLTLGGDVAIPPKSAEQLSAEALKGRGLRF